MQRLIEATGDSPPSCRRMFDLSSSGRNGKWSDLFFSPSSVSSFDLLPRRDSGRWRTSRSADTALPACRHRADGCQGVRGLVAAWALDEAEESMERGMMKKWEAETDRLQKWVCHILWGVKLQTKIQREEEEGTWSITERKQSLHLEQHQPSKPRLLHVQSKREWNDLIKSL